MEFDNKQFEAGIQQSKRETKETIKALDRLTESLRFEDATKGFSGIENALNKIDLSGIEKNVDTLSSRFSFFGNIGYNALNRISNKIIDTGRAAASFVTSLTQMANAASGFGKYEETVEATPTIIGKRKLVMILPMKVIKNKITGCITLADAIFPVVIIRVIKIGSKLYVNPTKF